MHRLVLLFCLATGAATAATGPRDARPAAAPPATQSIVPPNAPVSTFADDPGFGRDPFYPHSVRRTPKVVVPVGETSSFQPVPDFITLKGVSVIHDKKLAIINNYTVAEGEEFAIRYGSQVI